MMFVAYNEVFDTDLINRFKDIVTLNIGITAYIVPFCQNLKLYDTIL